MPVVALIASLVALLLTPVTAARAQNVLSGRIRGDDTGKPLAGAEVLITALSLKAVSDTEGRYRLAGIPAGHHEMEVRRIGYAPTRMTLAAEEADSLELDVVLLPAPFELPELTAEAVRVRSARLAAFEHRRRMGFGRHITEEDLAARKGSSLTDVLRTRGVNIAVDAYRHIALPIGRGNPDVIRGTNSCTMHVVVDGVEIPSTVLNLNGQTIDQYAAIEIYQRPSEIPIEYTATGFSCGAIFLWTKT